MKIIQKVNKSNDTIGATDPVALRGQQLRNSETRKLGNSESRKPRNSTARNSETQKLENAKTQKLENSEPQEPWSQHMDCFSSFQEQCDPKSSQSDPKTPPGVPMRIRNPKES